MNDFWFDKEITQSTGVCGTINESIRKTWADENKRFVVCSGVEVFRFLWSLEIGT
jgi:hypothetical protein